MIITLTIDAKMLCKKQLHCKYTTNLAFSNNSTIIKVYFSGVLGVRLLPNSAENHVFRNPVLHQLTGRTVGHFPTN